MAAAGVVVLEAVDVGDDGDHACKVKKKAVEKLELALGLGDQDCEGALARLYKDTRNKRSF